MTCYEILTGGIPLEEVRASDYDTVLFGKRPKLPSDLNPKVKDFINRCWHQDPEARPMFNEVVVELEGLCIELAMGSELAFKIIDGIFHDAKNLLDIVGAGPEASLVELKALLQALLVKYHQGDFLLLGMEIVADMEQFQSQFGLRSNNEQPVLPFSEWLARKKLHDSISWKMKVFSRIRANIVETFKIATLVSNIMVTIGEDHGSNGIADIQSENLVPEPEMVVREYEACFSDLNLWADECQRRVLPEYQHRTCLQQRLDGFQDGESQACGLCKRELQN